MPLRVPVIDDDPQLVGIIMTGHGSTQEAVEAMTAGAFDFILKPFRVRLIRPILDRAVGVRGSAPRMPG